MVFLKPCSLSSECEENVLQLKSVIGGAAIAQWIHLGLPSSRPRFESQAHQQSFYHLKLNLRQICFYIVKERIEDEVWPF